jgi:arsenate reductase
MANILYGIPNCDQIKKARTWLDAHDITYLFHDFKKSGLTPELVKTWLQHVTWDSLVNRKGTTWRALAEDRKAAIVDAYSATQLMLELPSVIKRPVLQSSDTLHVGFSSDHYQQIFKK